jgi:hypothetical protein
MFGRGFAFVWLSMLAAAPAAAATLTDAATKDGKVIAVLAGDITEGDANKLKAMIKAANDGGRLVYAIRLNSIGGNLAEGVRLAEIIRQAKLVTSVTAGATCASACFIAFAAGSEKFASYSAAVGVHGASDKSGRETPTSTAATVAMGRIVKELGVPPAIIGKMVVTPPTEMVWLSPDDLRSMGATLTGKPSQTAPGQAFRPQLPPEPTIQASKPRSWEDLVKNAVSMSTEQNRGRPNITRSCQPEFKVCNIAVHFNGKSGGRMIVKTTENIAGKVIRREVCKFNEFLDVRSCLNWDTGESQKDMKNSRGDWIKVADE